MKKMGANTDRDQPDTAQPDSLFIYGYPQCPFCRRVLDTVRSLGLEIPLRNTLEDAERHSELQAAMGRTTVPVLAIERSEGEVEWLPESADIVRYLKARFG